MRFQPWPAPPLTPYLAPVQTPSIDAYIAAAVTWWDIVRHPPG
jgi:hypothetical protein